MKNLSDYIKESLGVKRNLGLKPSRKSAKRGKDMDIRLNESKNFRVRRQHAKSLTESSGYGVETKTLDARDKTGFVCTRGLYQEAIEKFGDGVEVINPCYTRYGGTFADHALIKYYQENCPEQAVWENTSWDGENMIALPVEGMERSEWYYAVDGFEDVYYELERELTEKDARYFCEEENCEDRFDDVVDWLENNGNVQATEVDYNWDALKEYIKNGTLDECVKEKPKFRIKRNI